MKNNEKMQKIYIYIYIKALSSILLWTRPIDQWCNKLQTLERQRTYIGVILSGEHTLIVNIQ